MDVRTQMCSAVRPNARREAVAVVVVAENWTPLTESPASSG